jgi:DNA primase
MKNSPEWLALQQAFVVCGVHEEALLDAIVDLKQRNLTADDLLALSKEDRRLLDQFAYRYTRLQDDMGARLIPAVLRALGEEIAAMPMLDRLSRMEQLGWLPDAEAWAELRRIRNEFAHDYPETLQERFERLQLALSSAQAVTEIFNSMSVKISERFPAI